MAKVTLTDLVSSFLSKSGLNNNFQQIEDDLNNKVLYRDNPDGEPNHMENVLDMNSNRVINIGDPINDGDAVRLGDIPDVSTVESRVTTLETEMDSVESDVSSLQTTTSSQASSITTLNTEMDSVESDVSTLQTDVGTLQTEMDSVESDVGTLQTEMDAVESDIVSLDGRVTTLENESGGGGGTTSATKNYLINGSFDVFQRGIFATESAFVADRWFHNIQDSGGGGAALLQKATFFAGQTDVPGQPLHYLTHDQTSATSAGVHPELFQRIENVRTLNGETAVFSFWARETSLVDVSVKTVQHFGSGGSADVTTIHGSPLTLTGDWAKYEVAVSVPSISGKSIIDGENYLQIGIEFPDQTTFNFDIAQVQFELGSTSTDMEYLSYDEHYRNCLRFYEKQLGTGSSKEGVYSGVVHSSNRGYWGLNYYLKRAKPAVTLPDMLDSYSGNVFDVHTIISGFQGRYSTFVRSDVSTSPSLIGGDGMIISTNGSDTFIELDAEF